MGHNWGSNDQLKKIIMTYDLVTPLERWELVQPDPCKTPLVCTDNIYLMFSTIANIRLITHGAGGGYHVVKKALGISVSVGRLLIQSVCHVLNLKRQILDKDG